MRRYTVSISCEAWCCGEVTVEAENEEEAAEKALELAHDGKVEMGDYHNTDEFSVDEVTEELPEEMFKEWQKVYRDHLGLSTLLSLKINETLDLVKQMILDMTPEDREKHELPDKIALIRYDNIDDTFFTLYILENQNTGVSFWILVKLLAIEDVQERATAIFNDILQRETP